MIENKEELLKKHLELVIKVNKKVNLTRIDSYEEAQLLHIEDSLSALEEFNESPEGLYGDLGSGAGYPGIPIAIHTGRQTVLVDSVEKKTKTLRYFIDCLNLENISVYNGRIETLACDMPGKFSVLSARALSSFSSLIELASPLLKNKGRLICYKSHVEEEDLKHVCEVAEKLGMKFISRREFYLSDNEVKRCIVVFEKISEPSIKLPRRIGLAQRKPF